uniref:Uncharacterized protein n=1 Tax=Tanacetum cinerariifolium TaxID=118510 RepID=A0A699GMM9_TANCI|nr:hypothetical protein [Tanacetum cinerariifolium]
MTLKTCTCFTFKASSTIYLDLTKLTCSTKSTSGLGSLLSRKRVEDLQLGIESYQTKLNLTEQNWDAFDFLYKEDYTIVSKPKDIIYRDRNEQKKMMMKNKVHKFGDGTLIRILERLDHMVKHFRLFKYNTSVEKRIWSEDIKGGVKSLWSQNWRDLPWDNPLVSVEVLRSNTYTGNLVQEILLNLNLPDHSNQVLKLKELQDQRIIKLSRSRKVEMDEANLTMEEYIKLEAKKARTHDFLAIIYDDSLTTDHEVSSKPTVRPLDNNEIDFRISLDESNNEDYICIYDKSSFSYKLIYVNDLKPDLKKDIDEFNLPRNDVIEQLDSSIDYNVDTQSYEFDEDFETNHDAHRESFNMEENFIIIGVIIQKSFHEGMPLVFITKNLYVTPPN